MIAVLFVAVLAWIGIGLLVAVTLGRSIRLADSRELGCAQSAEDLAPALHRLEPV